MALHRDDIIKLRNRAVGVLSSRGRYATMTEVEAEAVLDLCNRALQMYAPFVYKRKAQKKMKRKARKED